MAYSTDQFNEELMHYGVLGMKWGVRHDRRGSGGGTSRYRKAVNKFTNSKIGSKYKLHDDPEEELREVEGMSPNTNRKSGQKGKREALQKQYGKLEDQMTYGKKADAAKNARLEAQMEDIEKQIRKYMG